MKKLLLLPILVIGMAVNAQSDITAQLTNLAPPSSPAFVLMDIAPSTVYVPESLKAMSLQVLNGLGGESGNGFPKNFAAEIVPFWYTRPKNMNALEYHNFKKSDPSIAGVEGYDSYDIFGDIFKKASISFAYMDGTFEVFDSPQDYISVGARTTLIKVIKKQDIKNTVTKYKEYENFLKTNPEVIQLFGNTDPSQLNEAVQKLESWQAARAVLQEAINIRPVFLLDVSVAYSSLLRNEDSGYGDHFGRLGVWLSSDLALQFSNNPNNLIHIYAVGRYLQNGLNLDSENTLFTTDVYDVGGKLEFEFNALSVGYEYLSREGDDDQYRSLGTVRYKISDSFTLSGGFGKNFNSGDDTISLLGVKWALNTGEGGLSIPGLTN
jgi:hypothetical protein